MNKHRVLEFETEETIYEIEFGQIQIEITGKCNMHCSHCRASNQVWLDMPVQQIVKIVQFARQFSDNNNEVVVSGGEPLLHGKFQKVLNALRSNDVKAISLTTNGSLLTIDHLRQIRDLAFDSFCLSVSIDNINPVLHDHFRGFVGAFEKASNALRLIAESDIPGIVSSMRCTIQPSQIYELERFIEYAREKGCKRIAFSAVHPAGRAIKYENLWMTREQKFAFIQHVFKLKKSFSDISISTTDPLKCLVRGKKIVNQEDELVFDGCGAGVTTFNVDSNGNMTPCALLDLPMMNVFTLSVDEITDNYRHNPIVKNLLTRNLRGKCGKCDLKYQCGGCRARAHVQNEDYLGDDPHCWL